jgi:hypothetical protein
MRLDDLDNCIEFLNKKVVEHLKNKIKWIIRDNEEEFFNCLFGEQSDAYKKLLPVFEELSYYKLFITKGVDILFEFEAARSSHTFISYDFKNFWLPLKTIIVRQDKIQDFSKFDDLRSYYELIDYLEINKVKLRNFIYDKHQVHTLSVLLKMYPELCAYVKDYFGVRFKLKPYKDPKKHKELPKHLGDYIRKVQFIMKTM